MIEVLSKYNKRRILHSLMSYDVVDTAIEDALINYIVYGIKPGSMLTAMLANDMHGVLSSSHPSNTVEFLKNISNWIRNELPTELRGSYNAVGHWMTCDSKYRRRVLENYKLLLSQEEEIMLSLQGKP